MCDLCFLIAHAHVPCYFSGLAPPCSISSCDTKTSFISSIPHSDAVLLKGRSFRWHRYSFWNFLGANLPAAFASTIRKGVIERYCKLRHRIYWYQTMAGACLCARLPLRDGYRMYFNKQAERWSLYYENKYVKGSSARLDACGSHQGRE